MQVFSWAKDTQGRGEAIEAEGAQACCDSHHVLLGDADLDEPFGEALNESRDFRSRPKVGIQNHEVGVTFS